MRWLGAVLLLVLFGVNVARFSLAPATVAPSPMANTGSQHQRNTQPHSSRRQHDARQQQEVEGNTDKRLVLQGQASGKHEGGLACWRSTSVSEWPKLHVVPNDMHD